jgi:hypothetical protein
MASTDTPQSYRNHAKNVPLFHYFTLPVLIANVMFALSAVVDGLSTGTVVALLVAIALFMTALYARVFALRAQDRVIRLEERLRMRELLPPDLQPRINDFTVDQLVALRFASDAELASLAARVLEDDVRTRKAIKQMVTSWRADHVRV